MNRFHSGAILCATVATLFLMAGSAFSNDWWEQQNGDIYNLNQDGNVGIGTMNPVAKLHVKGGLFSDGGSGDVDADDEVSAGDAIIVNTFLNGDRVLSKAEYARADANGDGIVDVFDLYAIFNISFGLDRDTIVMNSRRDKGKLFYVDPSNRIGVRTLSPQSEFSVNGTITAKELKVLDTGWADFVFEDDYGLPSLREVEQHIKEKKRLPDMPPAREVEENGLPVGHILAKQMQKIEELTLYLIELKKESDALKADLLALETGKADVIETR